MIGNRLFARLPERFRWTPHNLFAHPASEVLFQVGLLRPEGSRITKLGDWLHDWTIPSHHPNEEGRR